jgi:transposase
MRTIEGRENAHPQRIGELQHPADAGGSRGDLRQRPRGRGVRVDGSRRSSGRAVGLVLRNHAVHAFGHGARLREADDLPALQNARRDELLATPWANANAKRLVKRLRRYRDALFTFLDHPGVPSDNNHAEREIRPVVIIRKNSLCNRSENGARVQAILMSVYRTLKLRGLDPLDTIVAALKDYVRTGSLPPLPDLNTSDG